MLELLAEQGLIYQGSTSHNTLTGLDEHNGTYLGGSGSDTYQAGSGDDIFVYNLYEGNDTIVETGGNDRILMGPGITREDVEVTGSGENLVILVKQDDVTVGRLTVSGGLKGDDYLVETIEFSDGETLSITERLDSPLRQVGTVASEGLTGTHLDDIIYGRDGDDTLTGNGGEDQLYGDEGNDTITGGADADLIYGGRGADTIYAKDGDNQVFGDEGNDTIFGGRDADMIHGGDDDDTITGNGGFDKLYGGEGNDNITGGAATDELYGGEGNDTLSGGDGNNQIHGDEGDDTVYGGGEADHIYGGTGNDTLEGNQGSDVYHFNRGDGQDSIYDIAGTEDTILFGEGISASDISVEVQLYYGASSRIDDHLVLKVLDNGIETGDQIKITHGKDNEATLIENFEFSDGTQMTLEELMAEQGLVYQGSASNNTLTGFDEYDGTYRGEAGTDKYNAGSGDDIFIFNLDDGTDTISDVGGNDRVIFGEGISEDGIKLVTDGDDLVVQLWNSDELTSDTIKLDDAFIDASKQVEVFEFADGSEITLVDLIAQSEDPLL